MSQTLKLTCADLRQFTGDEQRYRHNLNRNVIYTPGVQYMANVGGAYWLVDEIALALDAPKLRRAMIADPRAREMLFWTLKVSPDTSGILTATVYQGEPPVYRKAIPWTDFPLDQVDVWSACDGRVWTLYLPSEH